jgi:hypothetical protein
VIGAVFAYPQLPICCAGMRLVGAAVSFVAFATAVAHAAPELVVSASPRPGIIRERWREPTIPAVVHVVQVDLTAARLSLVATPESMRGRTTSDFAVNKAATITINGGPFVVSGFRPYGLAIGSKMPWSNTADDAASAVFHFKRGAQGAGERTFAGIIPSENITALADLPVDTDGVISGRPLLIRAAALEANFDCADPVAIACQRAPRTAIALSEDGNTAWLVVVDGWQSASLGMTAAELARFLRDTKAPHVAMALDSGGSSTLVVNNTLLSDPSDGVERSVANHLAVLFDPNLDPGTLTGLICKEDVIACRDDPSLLLPGAEVTLDDGQVRTAGANASYSFGGISPRLACVTVRLDGYLTKTACEIVPPGGIGFESVAMFEGEDPPDAGPRDAGPDPDPDPMDAGLLPPDGGQPAVGEGGGCCDSRKSPSGVPILVGLVGFMLLRRRGTTAVR